MLAFFIIGIVEETLSTPLENAKIFSLDSNILGRSLGRFSTN